MKIAKLAAGIFLALSTIHACGGKSTEAAGGSNTNWFASCSASSECGGGLECWCGICTKTCASECSASAGATCTAPPPSCADPPQAAKEEACALQCTKDADCKAAGADATCVDSLCRRTSLTTTTRDSGVPLTCDDLTRSATNALSPLRDAADESCNVDADCVEFPGVSCTNACATVTISKTGLAAIQPQIDAVESGVCAEFQHQGCTVLEPPCVFPGVPGCVQGQCQHVLPGAPRDAGASSCDARLQQIGQRLTTALQGLDRSCQVDADCTRIGPEDRCYSGCPTWLVSKSAAAAFAVTRAMVDADVCDPFLADGCTPPAFFGCPEILAAPPACNQGICGYGSDTTPIDAGSICEDETSQMNMELQAVVDAADKSCAEDADCSGVSLGNACLGSCQWVAASTTGAVWIRDELATLDASSCVAFVQDGCTPVHPPCPSVPTGSPRCVAGKCQ
ncbi:MAG TPA: hypothetical protein VHC69_07195 [Polyangiaceae bacterium]|nr:hypothetical protein [Polyangiaceae bacterium]